jgi:hypothetical protein
MRTAEGRITHFFGALPPILHRFDACHAIIDSDSSGESRNAILEAVFQAHQAQLTPIIQPARQPCQ